jgi:hypothetical protein
VETRQHRARRWSAPVLGAALLTLSALTVIVRPAAGDEAHGHDPSATVPGDGSAPEASYRGILPPGTWTPEQVAKAKDLVHRTEVAAEKYDTQAEIEAAGYRNFGIASPGGWDHWGKRALNTDEHELDPEHPESLVFRRDPDGYKLYAVMFMLPSPPYSVGDVPAEWAWLPGWHNHDGEFCTDVETGVWRGFLPCGPGTTSSHPEPMVHVWIRDIPQCNNRFGGVGVGGVHCGHHGANPIPECPPPPTPVTWCRWAGPFPGTVPGTVLRRHGGTIPPAQADPVGESSGPTGPTGRRSRPPRPVRATPRYTG